jgi:hypothetical protein
VYPFDVHDPGRTRTDDLRIKRTAGDDDTPRAHRERGASLGHTVTRHTPETRPNGGASVSGPCPRSATCGWCLGDHPTHACPRGPRLSLAAVLASALEAMVRPARGWA